jgi:hypothetical protein
MVSLLLAVFHYNASSVRAKTMHSFLFVGSTKDKRQEQLQAQLTQWEIFPADIVALEPSSEHITIGDVREFQKRLLLAPMQSTHTAGIIKDAHLLTTEAQQALLKLLEEPPPHAYIVCETDSSDQLLPTIVSRCHITRMIDEKSVNMSETITTLETLMQGNIGAIMTQVDLHTAERTDAKAWTRELLHAARHMLLMGYKNGDTVHTQKLTTLIRNLQKAERQLAVNCNPKLVLDTVFLSS